MNYSVQYESLYFDIVSKLKKHSIYKRMFKKPNYIEGSDSLNNLVKLMNEEECPEYAGVFYLTKARCDSAAKDVNETVNDLILGAENFFKAERKLKKMNITSTEDFLECGIMCYHNAVNVLIDSDQSRLALSNGLHLVSVLKEFHKYNDAVNVYNILIPLVHLDLEQTLVLTLEKALCHIKSRNFSLALGDYNQVLHTTRSHNSGKFANFGRFRDFMEEAEVYRVLLVLRCETYQKEMTLLSDYVFDKVNPRQLAVRPLLQQINEELFYHLTGLVHAVTEQQSHMLAEEAALALQSILYDWQNELVREIAQELVNPTGDAF